MNPKMMRHYAVPYSPIGGGLDHQELQILAQILHSGKTLQHGEYREQFEKDFADFIGVKYAYTVTNCTAALELATELICLQPGDEVIVPSQTYQATIASLLTHPGPVRFCDVDPNSLNVDPNRVEALITPKTRAIFLVHYGGLMADMDAIMDLAEKHNLIVVEDCAHAAGSEYKGRKAGSTGHIGCFSFGSGKNMTTLGQGGMITFNRDSWAEPVDRLRSIEPDADFIEEPDIAFGPYQKPNCTLSRHEKNAYTHGCLAMRSGGRNLTLNESSAAVGSVQLRKLDRFNSRRREIAQCLDAAFAKIPGLRIQREPQGFRHIYHLYTFFVEPDSGLDKESMLTAIDEMGIEIVLRYFPLHLLPEWRFRGHRFGECPVTEKVWFEQQINLPCYPLMTDAQVQYMVDTVNYAVEKAYQLL